MLVSSHVLHEVQAVTPQIVLLNRGRLVAEGDVRQIRDLIDTHPHRIVLKCPDARALAAKLVALRRRRRRRAAAGRRRDRGRDPLARRVLRPAARLALEGDTPIEEVYSDDDNLEAVFKYLVTP